VDAGREGWAVWATRSNRGRRDDGRFTDGARARRGRDRRRGRSRCFVRLAAIEMDVTTMRPGTADRCDALNGARREE